MVMNATIEPEKRQRLFSARNLCLPLVRHQRQIAVAPQSHTRRELAP